MVVSLRTGPSGRLRCKSHVAIVLKLDFGGAVTGTFSLLSARRPAKIRTPHSPPM